MEWKDNAIILSSQKFGENSSLIRLLSREYGVYAGMVRGASGTRLRGIYQPGNLVEVRWKARLSEHLGSFSAELLESNAAAFLDDRVRLAALSALCSMTQNFLPERQAEEAIFLRFLALLSCLKTNSPAWQKMYVLFECALLTEIGFGLDMSECAATGTTEDLCYVSPKSGRAVSAAAGEPYKDKLFHLSPFLQNEDEDFTAQDIREGLRMTGYFLQKSSNSPLPAARERLAALLD